MRVVYYGKKAVMGTARDVTERKIAEDALKQSEKRYKGLFEGSPIAHVAEDWSEVKKYLDQQKAAGVTDFRAFFHDNPAKVEECFHRIEFLESNSSYLALFGADSLGQLQENFYRVFRDEAWNVIREEFIALAGGSCSFPASRSIIPLLMKRSIPYFISMYCPGMRRISAGSSSLLSTLPRGNMLKMNC